MKKYLISNRTEQEVRFLMYGSFLFGEINVLTYVFRLIGKYDELKKEGNATDINKGWLGNSNEIRKT